MAWRQNREIPQTEVPKQNKPKVRDRLRRFFLEPVIAAYALAFIAGTVSSVGYDKRNSGYFIDLRKTCRSQMIRVQKQEQKNRENRRKAKEISEFYYEKEVYRSRWLDPKNPIIKEMIAKMAKIQKKDNMSGSYSYLKSSVFFSVINDIVQTQCRNEPFSTRSIDDIYESKRASIEEKNRLLASFIIGAGGSVIFSDTEDSQFLFVLAQEGVTKEDVKQIHNNLLLLAKDAARRYGFAEPKEAYGRFFGKDYYVVADLSQFSLGLADRQLLRKQAILRRYQPQDY